MVVLYTIDCPKCKVLEAKLNNANIKYETVKDVNEMLSKGIKSAPYLEVDGKLMNFNDSVKWVNEQ